MSRQPQARNLDRSPAAPRRLVVARRRGLGLVLSLVGHVAVLLLLLSIPVPAPKMVEPAPITVQLIDDQRLLAAQSPPAPTKPAPAKSAPKRSVTKPSHAKPSTVKPTTAKPVADKLDVVKPATIAKRTPVHPDASAQAAEDVPMTVSDPELSEAQLAGAETAGSGSGQSGGTCDMAGRLQGALRKDPLVKAAVAKFAGKSMMVWDGDWLWFQGDTGKGLTAVRQALAWEIAFAPAACRAKPMHGLVVFSLNEAAGPVRLAVGLNDWRWSDMLTLHDDPPTRR